MPEYTAEDLNDKLDEYHYLILELEETDTHHILYESWTQFDHDADEYQILDNGIWYAYPACRVTQAVPPNERYR